MQHIRRAATGWPFENRVLISSHNRVAGNRRPPARSSHQSITVQTWRSRVTCSATPTVNGGDGNPSLLKCYQPLGRPTSQADLTDRQVPKTPSNDVTPSLQAPTKASPVRPRNGPSRPAFTPQPPTVITRIPEHVSPSILLNALLLVDKPQDWQASEVVTTIKWATKAPHVIHVGSLDAMASGLLVVAFGEAARLTPTFNVMSKRYKGTVRLGLGTETCDCTGKGTEVLPWKHVTDMDLSDAAAQLQGEVLLYPPSYRTERGSGKRLYQLATETLPADRVPRQAFLHSFSVSREAGSRNVDFNLHAARCGHVRSLAAHLAWAAGTCGHLSSLRRTSVGPFYVDNAWSLDVLLPLLRRYQDSSSKFHRKEARGGDARVYSDRGRSDARERAQEVSLLIRPEKLVVFGGPTAGSGFCNR